MCEHCTNFHKHLRYEHDLTSDEAYNDVSESISNAWNSNEDEKRLHLENKKSSQKKNDHGLTEYDR